MTEAAQGLSPASKNLLEQISDWCLDPQRLEEPADSYVLNFIPFLNSLGLQMGGGSLVLRTMHPELEMMVQRWRPGGADEVEIGDLPTLAGQYKVGNADGVVEIYLMGHGHTDAAMYRASPFSYAEETGSVSSWTLAEHCDPPRFPIFPDLRERGETAYLVAPVPLPPPYQAGLSLSTLHPDGFPEDMVTLVEALLPTLGLSIAHKVERITMEEVLGAYLGRNAAQEVARGRTQLGDLRSLEAVVGFADLRGFTVLAQQVSGEELVATMNRFFAALDAAIRVAGGEILKFMGDGILFVFDCEGRDDHKVARGALRAMRTLSTELRRQNENEEGHPIRFAAALHRGLVRYGNVGAPARLDFTVAGADVAKAARLQELGAQEDQELVLSAEIADLLPKRTESLGRFFLRGFGSDQQVFVRRSQS